MRILICGSREWTDVELIRGYFKQFQPGTIVIEGEAPGADSIARDLAKEFGFECLAFPADWNRFPKAAGPIRNRQMLKEGKPDMVLAFHDDLSGSKGTKDMVTIARRANVRTYVIGHRQGGSMTSKPIASNEELKQVAETYGFALVRTKQYRFGEDFVYTKGTIEVTITKNTRGKAEWKVINTAVPALPLRGTGAMHLDKLLSKNGKN